MNRMNARGSLTAAAVIGAIAVSGCGGNTASAPGPPAHAKVAGAPAQASSQRLTAAPALVVQCAIDRAGLRPAGGQSWLSGQKVVITSASSADFSKWWRANNGPGPYAQTFVIDGHRTHYLSFGATWSRSNGQWVPKYPGHDNPLAQQQSLAGWAAWAAQNDMLPPAVCGTTTGARHLQSQIFSSDTTAQNPWGT